jgi:formylglycine-generating enzyme required for sulfatase activity
VFSPRGELVEVTLAFVGDDVRDSYAIDRAPGASARLYGWLAAVGDGLLARVPEPLRASCWGPIGVPRAELVAAMQDQARRARAMYADAAVALPAISTELAESAAPRIVPHAFGNERDRRPMIRFEKAKVSVGLTAAEADRLAAELARMEERLAEPGLAGYAPADLAATTARRRAWLATSVPAHEVEVASFSIDVYPVTNLQWKQFAAAADRAPPDGGYGPDGAFVTGISWAEAQAYAHYYGLDLPTEAEWEHAARDGRSFFTWGDDYFPIGDIAFREPVDRPCAVGSRPETASAHGVQDLLGQFGEYCRDPFAPYDGTDHRLWNEHFPDARGRRTVRGGYDMNQDATCVSRRGVPPDERRRHLKFRCVWRG